MPERKLIEGDTPQVMSEEEIALYRPEVEKPEDIFPEPTADDSTEIVSLDDYLLLKNITCTDADGNIFENYPEIYVAKDVVRDNVSKFVNFTLYQAITHFEKQGNSSFLPSYALTCNIVTVLFENKSDSEVEKVLLQYKKKDAQRFGYHAQNTLNNTKTGKVIHYPYDNDFPNHGGNDDVNQSKRIELDFGLNRSDTLENVLKSVNGKRAIQNLTGLKQPEVLVEIGDYFSKQAYLWAPSDSRVCAAWFGCSSYDFVINTNSGLDNDSGARRVLLNP
jgi:hypothetical protein